MEKITSNEVRDMSSSLTPVESAIKKKSKKRGGKGKKKPNTKETMEGSLVTEASTNDPAGLDNSSSQAPRESTVSQTTKKRGKNHKGKSSRPEDKPDEPRVPAIEQIYPSSSETKTDAEQSASGGPPAQNNSGPRKRNLCFICNYHCMKRGHMKYGAYRDGLMRPLNRITKVDNLMAMLDEMKLEETSEEEISEEDE